MSYPPVVQEAQHRVTPLRLWPGICAVAFIAHSTIAFAADVSAQVRVGAQTRTFSVHVPDRAPPAGGYPLILAFHGGGMQGEGMRRLTHLDDVADARDVVVIYPDGVGRHWNDGRSTIKNPQDDVRFVTAIIDRAQHDYHVNPHQVYATGISNGALFAERLGCDLSERIGGIAAVAGTMPVDIAARCRPSHPVAVLQIDGNADPIMPFEGGAVADFGGAGEGGQVLSVATTVASWAQRNGCARAEPAQLLAPVAALDRTRVSRTDYAGCAAGAPVTAYTVLGGGHTWPGGPQYARPRIVGWASMQLDASSTIVDFFLAQTPRAR